MWNFTLNRRGGTSLQRQLALQTELMILRGEIQIGQKLPSIRQLARRLNVQRNTVAAAYRRLKALGRVQTTRGSGAYLRTGAPRIPPSADLEATIRDALRAMWRDGLTADEVREAIAAWLASPLPDRLVIVDPVLETAEVVAHELRAELDVPVESCLLAEAEGNRHGLGNSVVAALPLHAARLRDIESACRDLTVLPLKLATPDLGPVRRLPPGALVLVVSHSPRVLAYAAMVIHSLRGEEALVQCHLLRQRAAWMPYLKLADLVVADAIAHAALSQVPSERRQQLRLVSREAVCEVRATLSFPPVRLARPLRAHGLRPLATASRSVASGS